MRKRLGISKEPGLEHHIVFRAPVPYGGREIIDHAVEERAPVIEVGTRSCLLKQAPHGWTYCVLAPVPYPEQVREEMSLQAGFVIRRIPPGKMPGDLPIRLREL